MGRKSQKKNVQDQERPDGACIKEKDQPLLFNQLLKKQPPAAASSSHCCQIKTDRWSKHTLKLQLRCCTTSTTAEKDQQTRLQRSSTRQEFSGSLELRFNTFPPMFCLSEF
ncbi:uncharacterized protein V6R79_023408 [Siganus canaliculatus]